MSIFAEEISELNLKDCKECEMLNFTNFCPRGRLIFTSGQYLIE
jgi:hypothetical protein